MWYEECSEDQLDYSKPIIATRNTYTYLLLPNIPGLGFCWFSIDDGTVLVSGFETVEEAIKYCKTYGGGCDFVIANAGITVEAF